eukprot:gene11434-biopygen3355
MIVGNEKQMNACAWAVRVEFLQGANPQLAFPLVQPIPVRGGACVHSVIRGNIRKPYKALTPRGAGAVTLSGRHCRKKQRDCPQGAPICIRRWGEAGNPRSHIPLTLTQTILIKERLPRK